MAIVKKTDSLFGTKERALKRKKHQQAIEKHTHYLISDFLPELIKAQVSISSVQYKTQLTKLLQKLEADNTAINDLRIARNYLARFINDGNKTEKWLLDVPPYLHRVQREQPLKTEKWFKRSKSLNEWVKLWLDSLETRGAVEPTLAPAQVLANTLISAAIFGGLCFSETLVALKKQLLEEKKPLNKVSNIVWLDLIFDSNTQAHNTLLGDQTLTLRRWYPDNFTLSWIHHFLRVRRYINSDQKQTAWHLIREQIYLTDSGLKKKIKSLKQFSESALGVSEQLGGVSLNQALTGYLMDKIPSSSLPGTNHNALLSPKHYLAIDNIQGDLTPKSPTNFNHYSRNQITLASNYELVISTIRVGLLANKVGATKNTPKSAKLELEKIELGQYPKSLSALIQWLIHLLSENKKVSTVSRYFSAIGKPWLAATAGVDIDELDSEDFESLYKNVLDNQLSEKNRFYMAGRFNQFHLYLSRNHDLPVLTCSLDDSHLKSRSFVRASFIPERAFTAFIKSIEGLQATARNRQTLQCLYILAFRCGLRRGELLKLRLQDIEESPERWLFIRNNRFGNNKSPSALRKVPMTSLLSHEEAKLFEDYLAYKKSLGDSTKALLFSQEQGAHIPLDGNYISTLAKNLLSKITGFPIIFHHFRHTALSRLQIILEDDKELINEVINYPKHQIKQIKKILGGFDNSDVKRDIYWAIAGFAGHLTPETTFNNYLHFSDRIASNKLKGHQHFLSANLIKQISGLSSNKITRILGTGYPAEEPVNLKLFTESLNKELEKYCNKLSSPKTNVAAQVNNEQENSIYLQNKQSPTVETCLVVLKAAEKQATMHELVLRFNLEEKLIKRWLINAKKIAKLSTSKNKSRVFSRYKAETPAAEYLAPSPPQTNAELVDAEFAIKKLRSLYQDNKYDIKLCMEYFINNVNKSKSGLVFSSPELLQRYLTLMAKIFTKNRFRLQFTALQSDKLSQFEQIKVWRRHSLDIVISPCEKEVRRESKFPVGKLTVFLTHPDEKSIIEDRAKNQYSTNVLTYIFHILAIMI